MKKIKTNILILGGGPAGIAAALKAYRSGARNITIVEMEDRLGGIPQGCVHRGFGEINFSQYLSGPEYIAKYLKKLESFPVQILTNTTAYHISPDRRVYAVNLREGVIQFEAEAIILALGCCEKGRGSAKVFGERPAGVISAGCAQQLINEFGILPGRRVVVIGSGDVGLITADLFINKGAQVKAVIEIMPYPGGLSRNIQSCIKAHNIPLLLSHKVLRVIGKQRVEAVEIARIDSQGDILPETKKLIPCDCVIFSVGLRPNISLLSDAKVEIDPLTGGPSVDEWRQTSVPGVFACGNLVQVHDLVDYVSQEGTLAGEGAARFIQETIEPCRNFIKIRPGAGLQYIVPQRISTPSKRDEVILFTRVKKPARDVFLVWGNGGRRKPLGEVVPSRTIRVELNVSDIKRYNCDGEFILKLQK